MPWGCHAGCRSCPGCQSSGYPDAPAGAWSTGDAVGHAMGYAWAHLAVCLLACESKGCNACCTQPHAPCKVQHTSACHLALHSTQPPVAALYPWQHAPSLLKPMDNPRQNPPPCPPPQDPRLTMFTSLRPARWHHCTLLHGMFTSTAPSPEPLKHLWM
jgi:hypothetical protein